MLDRIVGYRGKWLLSDDVPDHSLSLSAACPIDLSSIQVERSIQTAPVTLPKD